MTVTLSRRAARPAPKVASPVAGAPAIATRIASIDAFRGFVMFLMLAEAMRLWTLHDGVSRQPVLGASSRSTRRTCRGRAARCTI